MICVWRLVRVGPSLPSIERKEEPVARGDKDLPAIVVLGAGLGGTIAAFEIEEAVRGIRKTKVRSPEGAGR